MIIQPGGTSVGGSVSASTSSSERPIPPLSNGANPKWVHICVLGSNLTAVFVFGQTGIAAANSTNGIGVVSNGTDVIINVAGNTHYRVFGHTTSLSYSMTPLAGVFPGG